MVDAVITIGSTNVNVNLGMFISNRIADLRDKLAETPVTENEKVVRLCAEMLEFYKVVEKNDFILYERSKNYES